MTDALPELRDVDWRGAVEVHASFQAAGIVTLARDRQAAYPCGCEPPATMMGHPLLIDPRLAGTCLEILYGDGACVRVDLSLQAMLAGRPDHVPTENPPPAQATENAKDFEG